MKQQCKEFSYKEVGTLLASDAHTSECFGSSVAISGNRLVVSAARETTAGPDAGKVYIYNRDTSTSTYVEVATITASDAQASDWFGRSVALAGNRLVVGASFDDTAEYAAGKVYVYDWDISTSTYVEVATITASDAQARDYFGHAVALSSDGDRLLVGACGVDTAGIAAGKVYVYERNGAEQQ